MKSKMYQPGTFPKNWEDVRSHSTRFTHFALRWCMDNSSYEFYELDEETQESIYNEFLEFEINERKNTQIEDELTDLLLKNIKKETK